MYISQQYFTLTMSVEPKTKSADYTEGAGREREGGVLSQALVFASEIRAALFRCCGSAIRTVLYGSCAVDSPPRYGTVLMAKAYGHSKQPFYPSAGGVHTKFRLYSVN